MKAIERLFVFFEAKGIKHTPIERELGLTNGYLGKMRDRKGSIGSDILETIFSHFPDLNPDWLIMGNGTMLRSELEPTASQSAGQILIQPNSSIDQTPIVQIFVAELSKKDGKIEELTAIITKMTGELATLKAQHSQHESQSDEIALAFPSDSLEGCMKDSLPMRNPTTSSEGLSAGKIL